MLKKKRKKYIIIMAENREYRYVTYAKDDIEALDNIDIDKYESKEEMDTDNCWECISIKESEEK